MFKRMLLICIAAVSPSVVRSADCSAGNVKVTATNLCIIQIKAFTEAAQAVQDGRVPFTLQDRLASGRSGVTDATSATLRGLFGDLHACSRPELIAAAPKTAREIWDDALSRKLRVTVADDFVVACAGRLAASQGW